MGRPAGGPKARPDCRQSFNRCSLKQKRPVSPQPQRRTLTSPAPHRRSACAGSVVVCILLQAVRSHNRGSSHVVRTLAKFPGCPFLEGPSEGQNRPRDRGEKGPDGVSAVAPRNPGRPHGPHGVVRAAVRQRNDLRTGASASTRRTSTSSSGASRGPASIRRTRRPFSTPPRASSRITTSTAWPSTAWRPTPTTGNSFSTTRPTPRRGSPGKA